MLLKKQFLAAFLLESKMLKKKTNFIWALHCRMANQNCTPPPPFAPPNHKLHFVCSIIDELPELHWGFHEFGYVNKAAGKFFIAQRTGNQSSSVKPWTQDCCASRQRLNRKLTPGGGVCARVAAAGGVCLPGRTEGNKPVRCFVALKVFLLRGSEKYVVFGVLWIWLMTIPS